MNFSELTKGWVRIGDQVIDLSKICAITTDCDGDYTALLSSGQGFPIPPELIALIKPYLQELKIADTKTTAEGYKVGGGPYITEQPRPLLGRVEEAVANDIRTAGAEFIEIGRNLLVRRDQIIAVLRDKEGVSVALDSGIQFAVDEPYWPEITASLL